MNHSGVYNNVVSRNYVGVTALLFLWLCGGLVYVLPNQGGAGLALPQNLLTWAVMALISLWCVFHFPKSGARQIIFTPDTLLILVGVLFWSLPLLWSPRVEWQLNAIQKVAALWGMVGFFLLLQYTMPCRRLRSYWLMIIVFSSLIQAVYGLWQIQNVPDLAELTGGRPYGSFQQVNVYASFIATGLACAMYLFIRSTQRTIRYIAGISLFILPVMLVLLQSRAGYLGVFLSVLFIFLFSAKNKKKRCYASILLLSAGVGTGLLWLYTGLPAGELVDKQSSTQNRIYMLKLTWELITLRPITGNGYGSFEALYGQLAQFTPQGVEGNTVKYPHNELLYAWAEGGIMAVMGILLMIAGVFKRLWARGGTRFIGVATLLPLAVHMNLEYPLYQSMTHGLVLIMLLTLNGCEAEVINVRQGNKKIGRWLSGSIVGVIATGVLVFMLTGLQTQNRLTTIEQQGLMPLVTDKSTVEASLLNPYSQLNRLDFDRHISLLLQYNFTRDPLLLEQFRKWAERYLQVHNDPSVYVSLIMISRAQHRQESGALCIKAHKMWPTDPRFNCS